MNWYLDPLRRCFDWQGRTTRKEYWLFYLINSSVIWLTLGFVMLLVAAADDSSSAEGLIWIWLLYLGFTFVAAIALNVRRLHDIDKSGWHQLLFLIPIAGIPIWLFFMCSEGTQGINQYGAPIEVLPKASQTTREAPQAASTTSHQGSENSQELTPTKRNDLPTDADPQVAELRKKLAIAEAAAAKATEADNLHKRRSEVVERIKDLEQALAATETKIKYLKETAADNLRKRRSEVVERIKDLEQALAAAETKIK